MMYTLLFLIITILVIYMVTINYNSSTSEVVKKEIKIRILVLLSTFIITLPLKIMFSFTDILAVCVFITIANIFISKLVYSIYIHNCIPSLYNIFISILLSLFVLIVVLPLLYLCFDLLLELELIDLKSYSHFIINVYYVYYDASMIQGTYMTNRTPELQKTLRDKRYESQFQDYYCNKAFDKFNKELNPSEKRRKFRELLALVGKRRDLCKEIDSLANNKSSSTAFKNKAYSIYVANFIKSITKK